MKLSCPHKMFDDKGVLELCWPCLYKKERENLHQNSPKRHRKTVDEIKPRRIHFERSENYQAEVDYYKWKN